MLIVLRSTRNIKSLFSLKDKVGHRSCVIYEEKCPCRLSCIRHSEVRWKSKVRWKRNSQVRWKEHEVPVGKSESAKHLIENASHQFTRKVLSIASSHFRIRKIQKAFVIALRRPALND